MREIDLVAPLGVVFLLALVYLHRQGSRAASLWAWSWAALYGTALISSQDAVPTALWVLGDVLATSFLGLLLAGAIVFRGRPVPRWLAPTTAAAAAARGVATLTAGSWLSFLIGIPIALGFGLAATSHLFVRARAGSAALPERALAPSVAALTLASSFDLGLRASGADTFLAVTLFAWISVATVAVQVLALAARSVAATRRLAEETSRAEAEVRRQVELLEAEGRKLRAVIEAPSVGPLLYENGDRVVLVNRALATRLQLGDPEAWVGCPVADLLERAVEKASDPHGLLESFRERVGLMPGEPNDLAALIDAVPTNWTIEGLPVDLDSPEARNLLAFSSPVLSKEGGLLGRVWVARDVTEERALENQLRQAQKMETVGQLAGGLAHDFNNQLTVILGSLHLALEHLPTDSDARDPLETLGKAAEHCAQLTRRVLSFSRKTAGRTERIDPRDVLANLEDLLQSSLGGCTILELRYPREVRPIRADQTQLQQILTNLVLNASDALGARGRIVVGASDRDIEPGRVPSVPGARPGRFVEFSVVDDGAGMDTTTRERIFDPFFTTKPPGEGTGLGLSVVYGLVQAHAGWVEVESQAGHGSTFRVVLPADEEPAIEVTAAPVPPPRPEVTGVGTVLLADDESELRRTARRVLEQAGYRVIEAADGEAAVHCVRDDGDTIDLLLLDLNMPRGSGVEALAAIRRLGCAAPALLMTGRVDLGERAGALAGTDVLEKPFRADELTARVAALVRRDPRMSGTSGLTGSSS